MALISSAVGQFLRIYMEGVLTAEYAITPAAVGRKAAVMQARLVEFEGVA